MKKVIFLLLITIGFQQTFATALVKPKNKVYAADIMIPLGNNGARISLLDMSALSVKEAEIIRGEKMKLSERIAFKVAQKKLRKTINPDGSINDRRIVKNLKKVDGNGGFHAGGFFLGFLLGLIGLIIALLINDDKKKIRTKWALIGWGLWVAIVVLAVIL